MPLTHVNRVRAADMTVEKKPEKINIPRYLLAMVMVLIITDLV